MPFPATQATLGFKSPGAPGSTQELLWKAMYLRRCTSVRVVHTLWVHRSVRVIFNALILFLQREGARLGENVDDWGFANRPIRGVPQSSYHRWGLAIDCDATENPMGVRDTSFKHPNKVRFVCGLLGLRWGLDYTGRPDPMHFEHTGSIHSARALRRQLVDPKSPLCRKMAAACGMTPRVFAARVKSRTYPPAR